jgi:methyl-accepting chemotaxis protein
MSGQSKAMSRMNGILGLFIGIFGALAILGVFFKIANYPGWEIMMAVGFIGEAGAFIIMGVFALIAGLRGGTDYQAVAERQESRAVAPMPAFDDEAFRAEMREMAKGLSADIKKQFETVATRDLSAAVGAVGEQTAATCDEMRALGDSLAGARQSVDAMRKTLGEAAAGHLAADAERLGMGMRSIADGMEEAGAAVEQMRRDVTLMAERFRAFNGAGMSENGHVEQTVRRV